MCNTECNINLLPTYQRVCGMSETRKNGAFEVKVWWQQDIKACSNQINI